MTYLYEATSAAGMVAQINRYLVGGFFHFVSGLVPEGKDPALVDEKLMSLYGVRMSRWQRARRIKGVKNGDGTWLKPPEVVVHYLRFRRFWVLMARRPEGVWSDHPFFELERENIKNATRDPIVFWGYSISFRNGHCSVGIRAEEYKRLKAFYASRATRRSHEWWEAAFHRFPYEPYFRVKRQLFNLHRGVNRQRAAAGLSRIPYSALRLRRKSVKVFGPLLALPEPELVEADS